MGDPSSYDGHGCYHRCSEGGVAAGYIGGHIPQPFFRERKGVRAKRYDGHGASKASEVRRPLYVRGRRRSRRLRRLITSLVELPFCPFLQAAAAAH